VRVKTAVNLSVSIGVRIVALYLLDETKNLGVKSFAFRLAEFSASSLFSSHCLLLPLAPSLETESTMKFSIILFLVAALGSSDMLVSSQDEPAPATSPDLVDFHLGSHQNVQEHQDSAISNSNLRKNVRAGSVPEGPLPRVG
jgi:hypothetical protein